MVAVVVAIVVLLVIGWQQNHAATTVGSDQPFAPGTLPPEAHGTIAPIDDDGPFPYAGDGVVFMNRERLLPQRQSGYWWDHTVPIPGESDRGARRIVHGDGGELYYADDHYVSFTRVSAAEWRQSR